MQTCAKQASPAFAELAEALGGEHTADVDQLPEAAMSLQSPSGSPRRDGFSRGAGHVRPRACCQCFTDCAAAWP